MTEEKKSFKVYDRRRFDEDGNDREASSVDKISEERTSLSEQPTSDKTSAAASQRAPSHAAVQDAAPDFIMKESESDASNSGDAAGANFGGGASEQGGMLSFSSFLMSLATQALMQMGEMEPPGGLRLPPDFEAAKQTIEVIGMLAIKTKGNLDAEEQRLLAEVLHSIRLTFVQRVKLAMANAGQAAATGVRRPAAK